MLQGKGLIRSLFVFFKNRSMDILSNASYKLIHDVRLQNLLLFSFFLITHFTTILAAINTFVGRFIDD